MELHQLLELKMENEQYSEGFTLRHFFLALIYTLWTQDEGFSGKRPFGNSGWKYDVYVVLIRNGVIPGSLDENGWVKEVDSEQADVFVSNNILMPLFSRFGDVSGAMDL